LNGGGSACHDRTGRKTLHNVRRHKALEMSRRAGGASGTDVAVLYYVAWIEVTAAENRQITEASDG